MKKIIKPHEEETAVYYSDFSGKLLDYECGPPITLKMSFGYNSIYDETEIELHFDDKDLEKIIKFLKENLTEDYKNDIKIQIKI
jgi:hypothetical protein